MVFVQWASGLWSVVYEIKGLNVVFYLLCYIDRGTYKRLLFTYLSRCLEIGNRNYELSVSILLMLS